MSSQSSKPKQTSLRHALAGLPGQTYPQPPSHRSALAENDEPMSEEEERARALLDLSIALIDAALDVLEKSMKQDGDLQKPSTLMPGGSCGKHFRHVIEMFQAFLLPLLAPLNESSSSSSSHSIKAALTTIEINYDAPLPSSRRSIARSLPACRAAAREVRDGLIAWEKAVCSSSQPGHSEEGNGLLGRGVAGETRRGGLAGEMGRKVRLVAVTPTRQVMDSSVGRELWFCSLHAIHHFSMLRTIAVHELGLNLPVEFGTAPSTLLYRGNDWTPPPEKKELRVVKSKL